MDEIEEFHRLVIERRTYALDSCIGSLPLIIGHLKATGQLRMAATLLVMWEHYHPDDPLQIAPKRV